MVIVDARGAEFGYELACVLPYAYYLHKNGSLTVTRSAKLTNELYYFSDSHHEVYEKRGNTDLSSFPNPNVGVIDMKYDQWVPPLYKDRFGDFNFGFTKPLLIVHNKYNQEWSGPPVNFIDVPTLEKIFEMFSGDFEIVYSRPGSDVIVGDNSDIYALEGENDIGFTKICDLYKKFEEDFNNFNHFQLALHAACDKFISVQGGTSYLASYFGGTNIVYAVKGQELKGSFGGYFKKFSGCDVTHVSSYPDLLTTAKTKFTSPPW